MSSLHRRIALLLASLVAITALSSCTEGSLARLREVRTGAIGIGPTGSQPGDRLLPQLKPLPPAEMRVHLAVRRGVERALNDSPAFDYVPFVQMKQVPASITPTSQFEEVKKFAAANNLKAVIRVWVIPDLKQRSVSVSFITNAHSSKFIASAIAQASAPSPPGKDPATRAYLPTWEKTAYEATKNALAKVRG